MMERPVSVEVYPRKSGSSFQRLNSNGNGTPGEELINKRVEGHSDGVGVRSVFSDALIGVGPIHATYRDGAVSTSLAGLVLVAPSALAGAC